MIGMYLLYAIAFIAAFALVFVAIAMVFFRREVTAIFERDPAASNTFEVILTYPSLHAIMIYRLGSVLARVHIPFIPRVLSQLSRFLTGIEIHPAATIGPGLFIDHGMGVVIGETTVIGSNVTLYQGVTLGGTGKEKGKRHPTLGNNVVVGAGAKVLGNIFVGDNVKIGANAVVVRDVPPNSTVVGVPGRIAREEGKIYPGINLDHTTLPDPLTQALDRLQQEIDHIEGELKDWHQQQKHKR